MLVWHRRRATEWDISYAADLAGTASLVGAYVFLVFSVAAFAQLALGYLVDHYSIRLVFAVVSILQRLFFTIMIQLTGLFALLVAIAFMLAVVGQIPINDVLVGRMTASAWRSRGVCATLYRDLFSDGLSRAVDCLGSWSLGLRSFVRPISGERRSDFSCRARLPGAAEIGTSPG